MKKISFVFALALLIGAISCNLNSTNVTQPAAAFLIVNASPDAPPVDLFVNNSKYVSDIPYGSNTYYGQVAPGAYNLILAPTNTSDILVDTNFTFQPNANYSIFTIDSLSKIKAVIIADSLSAPDTGSVKIRFFNFSPNTPGVDFAYAGSTVISGNRTFNDQNANPAFANFITLKAGTYNFEIRLSGQTTALIPIPSAVLAGGKIYTFYLQGFNGVIPPQPQALSIGIINNL